jgi:AMME syndrome candidate gene 1 protein
MDWNLGQHGLRISFNYRSRRHGATYLPDVAVEQGWTKEETVESLMKKAGWDGAYGGSHGVARRLLRGSIRGGGGSNDQQQSQPPKPWEEVQDFRAIRYTGLRAHATYSEWQEWRKWVEKNDRSMKS